LSSPAAADPAAASTPSPRRVGLIITNILFPRESASDYILTMTGDQAAYVGGARWVAPARVLFEEAARGEFLTRTKTAELLNVGDTGTAGFALRLDVTAFEVRLFPGQKMPALVRVAVNARLTAADGKVVGQKEFASEVRLADEGLRPVVKGFDQATQSVLDDVGHWVDAAASPS